MSSNSLKFFILIPAMVLGACAKEPYDPIVDGRVSASYHADLSACRGVAQRAQISNRETTKGAIVGGLVGAVDADGGDEIGGAIVGAALGGAIGRAKASKALDEGRKQIVFNCMRGRGHNVVG